MKTPAYFLSLVALSTGPIGLTFVGCGQPSSSDYVTETGNPPLVLRDRLDVVFDDDGIRVVAASGAAPGGSRVTLTNEADHESVAVTADADGSFRVELAGESGDEYALVVEDGPASSTLLLQADTGSEAPSPPPGEDPTTTPGVGASCAMLEAGLNSAVAALADGVDRTCIVDSDCVVAERDVPCYLGCTPPPFVSNAGAIEVSERARELAATCAAIDSAECVTEPPPSCDLTVEPVVGCVAGQCDAVPPEELACRAQEERAVEGFEAYVEGLDRRCEADADCAVSSLGLSCFACSVPVVMNGVQVEAGKAGLVELDLELCAGWQENCWDGSVAGCQASSDEPRCLLEPAGPGQVTPPMGECQLVPRDTSCTGLESAATNDVIRAWDAAQLGCERDEDCEVIPEPALSCLFDQGACGNVQPIATAHREDLVVELERLEWRCREFTAAGCEPSAGACSPGWPTSEAICSEGRCAMAPATP